MAIIVILIILILLFAFLVKGRTDHPGMDALRNWDYAHRGLHAANVPENSLGAFAAAMRAGYGMELDVHLMKDGNLAVIHDSSLKRTAGAELLIEDMTVSDLRSYTLEGTQEKIPLLSEVLDLVNGRVPLIIELKSTKDNYASLCKTTCDLLDSYEGVYCMESFDPRCVAWLRKNRKEIIRGQLTENFLKSNTSLPWIMKFVMRHQLLNVFTRPDFIAYRYSDRKTISNFLCRKLWGVQGISWTIRTAEDYQTAKQEGWIPIFENFMP